MKGLWQDKREIVFIAGLFVFWRLFLFVSQLIGDSLLPTRVGFLGPVPWANFDGVHYLSIAQHGYFQYQQAFFPFFPLMIGSLASALHLDHVVASLILVHISFLIALFLLWKLIRLDYDMRIARFASLFLLIFPTSFFFGSVYTESLFLLLILGSFYAARKERWLAASILGGMAAASRFVGIFLLPALLWEWWEKNKISSANWRIQISNFFRKGAFWLLLIPVGLIGYMMYLQVTVGDPFAFIHSQPAFGASRSGGEIILLPQVIFRYAKIFITVPWTEYDLRIAMLEFFLFAFAMALLIFYFRKIRRSYFIFALFAILAPTLTGTLSSMPRYILVAFPIFIILASLRERFVKIGLIAISTILMGILTMLFTKGYFVA